MSSAPISVFKDSDGHIITITEIPNGISVIKTQTQNKSLNNSEIHHEETNLAGTNPWSEKLDAILVHGTPIKPWPYHGYGWPWDYNKPAHLIW